MSKEFVETNRRPSEDVLEIAQMLPLAGSWVPSRMNYLEFRTEDIPCTIPCLSQEYGNNINLIYKFVNGTFVVMLLKLPTILQPSMSI